MSLAAVLLATIKQSAYFGSKVSGVRSRASGLTVGRAHFHIEKHITRKNIDLMFFLNFSNNLKKSVLATSL